MNKIMIFGIAFILILAGVLLYVNQTEQLGMTYGPQEVCGEIASLDTPDTYTSNSDCYVRFSIKHTYDDSDNPADVLHQKYYYRVLDDDFIGPVHIDSGWSSAITVSGLVNGGVSNKVKKSFSVPSYCFGEDFNGILQIGHKYYDKPGYHFFIDDSMGFSIKYKAPSNGGGTTNHAPSVGSIGGSSDADINDPVNFYVNTYDQDDDDVYVKWDMGDGTTTDYEIGTDTASITHRYTQMGTYYVRAKPKDSHNKEGVWSSSKKVTVADPGPGTIAITVDVKDKDTLNFLSQVNISFNSESKITDDMGKVVFNILPGTYTVKVEKTGYRGYEEIHTFSESVTLNVLLSPEGDIPGFELLSLLIGLAVAVFIFKRFRL